ncbi:G5 domain-containing protein, partial [candidate division WWE3 bacterium]|nr:G5 domain-containing protein [candidate division WWE3 bacterium]
MLISTEDNEPNIRPKNLIVAVSIFVSTVGFWQIQNPASTPTTVQGSTAVMAATTELATDSVEKLVIYNARPIKTETSVKKEVSFEQEIIPFETVVSYDANQEVGYEIVTQYGENGYYDRSYEVEMFFGEEL